MWWCLRTIRHWIVLAWYLYYTQNMWLNLKLFFFCFCQYAVYIYSSFYTFGYRLHISHNQRIISNCRWAQNIFRKYIKHTNRINEEGTTTPNMLMLAFHLACLRSSHTTQAHTSAREADIGKWRCICSCVFHLSFFFLVRCLCWFHRIVGACIIFPLSAFRYLYWPPLYWMVT